MTNITLPYDWSPRGYQMPLWKHMQRPVEGLRAVEVAHRRWGKDLLAINLCATKAYQRLGTYWHILPTYQQGKKIVWYGSTREGRRFINHLPKPLIRSQNNTEMRIEFNNGSVYQVVGTDNIDSLVGTNPIGCVFSEYSLQNPAAWDYVRPILAENGGWALFIFTFRGKNHGYRMYEMARKNPDWFCEKSFAGNGGTRREDGSAVISDELIQRERDSGMPEELIRQEFYCDPDAPLQGAYYTQQLLKAQETGRITKVAHEPLLEVDTAWDLGVSDSTAIWFIQTIHGEHRIIDYYEASGEGLPHYVRVLRGQTEGGGHRADYIYGKHYAPHDIEVREFTSGKARIETARDLGIRFKTVPMHSVADGIDCVRATLPNCWFDSDRSERGYEALRAYRKEWDEKKQTFKDNPMHDWSSHGADAFRIFAMGHNRRNPTNKLPPAKAQDDYQYI